MLETKTLTSPTSSPSIRSVASTTLPWTALATSASFASESAVMNTSRWMDRSASTMPETPSISQAASAAMLVITSLATRTAPKLPLLPMQPMLRPRPLSPFHVGLRTGVDPDQIPGLDEQRHLDHSSRLECRRLGAAGHRIATKPRVRLDDFQLDVDRELDPDELALVPQQVGDAAFFEQRQHGLEHLLVDRHLVIGARVHEVVVRAIRIEVGRFGLVDADRREFVAAAKALVEDGPGQQVAKLGFDDRARPGQLDVLDVDDLEQLPVHLEHGPVAKVAGRDHSGCSARYSIASR